MSSFSAPDTVRLNSPFPSVTAAVSVFINATVIPFKGVMVLWSTTIPRMICWENTATEQKQADSIKMFFIVSYFSDYWFIIGCVLRAIPDNQHRQVPFLLD